MRGGVLWVCCGYAAGMWRLGAFCLICCACATSGSEDLDSPAVAGQAMPHTAVREASQPKQAAPAPNDLPKPNAVPLALNCQAPLVVTEEVARFLTTAATHATVSAACVDGPGTRVMIDDVLVCPARSGDDRRRFSVTFTVSKWSEGGRRVCSPNCPKIEAAVTHERVELSFSKVKVGYLLDTPTALAGLPSDATAATDQHDGNCYGKSPGFVPVPIAL